MRLWIRDSEDREVSSLASATSRRAVVAYVCLTYTLERLTHTSFHLCYFAFISVGIRLLFPRHSIYTDLSLVPVRDEG